MIVCILLKTMQKLIKGRNARSRSSLSCFSRYEAIVFAAVLGAGLFCLCSCSTQFGTEDVPMETKEKQTKILSTQSDKFLDSVLVVLKFIMFFFLKTFLLLCKKNLVIYV